MKSKKVKGNGLKKEPFEKDHSEEFNYKLEGMNAIGDLLMGFKGARGGEISPLTLERLGCLLWWLTDELLDMKDKAKKGQIVI